MHITTPRRRFVATALLLAGLLAAPLARPTGAAVSESLLALAGPLAEQFGVPASAVQGLLEGGLSLESVTQLLLVGQSSGTGIFDVAEKFRSQGNDITRTAQALEVEPSAYSEDKVTAAIERAKSAAAADATDRAGAAAGKAIDDALGGLR
jgi:hypothetical protein